jgi:hypothetical protein
MGAAAPRSNASRCSERDQVRAALTPQSERMEHNEQDDGSVSTEKQLTVHVVL